MKRFGLVSLLVQLAVCCLPSQDVDARNVGLVRGGLVNHPVSLPAEQRTPALWRSRAGAWGESFADRTLRLRGYGEIHEIKAGGNTGIDRIAIKRGRNGAIRDLLFVEVKTARGTKPRLGRTAYGGRQMSSKWLSENLRSMRRWGDDEARRLATEMARFRRASGRGFESFGEVMHVNPRTGSINGYLANGATPKYSQSAGRLLSQIEKRGLPDSRVWARQSRLELDIIQRTSMSSWLGKTVSEQNASALVANTSRSTVSLRRALTRHSRKVILRRALVKLAGPIAMTVSLAVDAKELADTELAYRRGTISLRQRNIRHATSVGGISGAFAGASAGAWAGAQLGLLGGPYAEITVPAGAFIGACVGGVGGYMGGSAVSGYAATAWYDSVDAKVRDRFEVEWLAQGVPNL